MPKRFRSDCERTGRGLLSVRFTANAALDGFLDLKSMSNLRASCHILHEQYDPDAVPILWAHQIVDPAYVLGNPNQTVQGAALLQNLYKFTASGARPSCFGIFTRASLSGDFQLAEWYASTYGVAGLAVGRAIMFDPIKLIEAGCERGHLAFVRWLTGLFDLELTVHYWSTLMQRAASSGVAMVKWVNELCPSEAATARFANYWRMSVLRATQRAVLLTIVERADVEMMRWAREAFACSRERLNMVVADALALRGRNEIARYILQHYGPIGRGPEAERIRGRYALWPTLATIVCPLPEEPEDSVFVPDDAADMELLPELLPEERLKYTHMDEEWAAMDAWVTR